MNADSPSTVATPEPAPAPAAPAPAPAVEPVAPPAPGVVLWGTGRRKTAVARVRLTAGKGKITINGREVEKYFSEPGDRSDVHTPFELTQSRSYWDALINVAGGGHTGQADAIKLGIARALMRYSERYEPALRDAGMLTRDSRKVERKKYGRSGARRRFQFSKR